MATTSGSMFLAGCSIIRAGTLSEVFSIIVPVSTGDLLGQFGPEYSSASPNMRLSNQKNQKEREIFPISQKKILGRVTTRPFLFLKYSKKSSKSP